MIPALNKIYDPGILNFMPAFKIIIDLNNFVQNATVLDLLYKLRLKRNF